MVLGTPGSNFYPQLPGALSIGPPRGDPGKSSNFKPLAKSLTNEKECRQGYQQTPKWHLKLTLWTPNYWISRKREITQNIWFLQWLWHMQPFHSGIIPISGPQKTWTWKLSVILQPQITENLKKVSKVGPGELPKSVQKSMKTIIWAPVCPLGVPAEPRKAEMVSRAPKKESQGLQNHSFRKKKWFISGVIQSSVACWQGAGGRGEALRYI